MPYFRLVAALPVIALAACDVPPPPQPQPVVVRAAPEPAPVRRVSVTPLPSVAPNIAPVVAVEEEGELLDLDAEDGFVGPNPDAAGAFTPTPRPDCVPGIDTPADPDCAEPSLSLDEEDSADFDA